MPDPSTLSIDVYFDLICPWCLIGKRHLDSALARFGQQRPDVTVSVEWHSFPLIPDIPPAGIPYHEFYLRRLGSPEALAARQAQVRAAASEAGVTLAFERMKTFPNTLLAHRLIRFARQSGGSETAAALVENLFDRYFLRTENIGDPLVLRHALIECDVQTPGLANAPIGPELDWLPDLHETDVRAPHAVTGVPHFIFNDELSVSGARPPQALLQAMQHALGRDQVIR
jgi:predicted DsbA family dithiol-disulfide isomerase